MQVVRIYTGDDGETHFEDLELPYEAIADAQVTAMSGASGVQLRKTAPGTFIDWHPAPRRQYVITLQGQTEIGIGDGTKRIFNAGDVVLADDLTGKGHTTEAVGTTTRVSVAIPLVD